ncbi:MAG: amino acid adenylation domain-containing protein [Bifidobacteriaceae bacterium]|jgi:amino acid adenylation domain-containing protein|nr:amino acid adenylation domain-containing protein [Bifidobacteriaceae bacterium]
MPSSLRTSVAEIADLTPLQAGMLHHRLDNPASRAYVLQWRIRLLGQVDAERVRQALGLLARRHDALRLAFTIPRGSGRPRQVILTERQPTCEVQDMSQVPADELPARLDQLARADIDRGFDLAKDPLMRVTLIRTGPQSTETLWCFHHLVIDGWSLQLVIADFVRFFEALATTPLPALTAQVRREAAAYPGFGDFLRWAAGRDQSAALDFWRDTLSGYEEAARVRPLARPAATTDQVKAITLACPPATCNALKRLGAVSSATMSSVVTAAWGLLLARYARREDVVFGRVVSGRDGDLPGVERLVGPLINTVPARVRFSPTTTVRQVLREFQAQVAAATAHDHAPLAAMHRFTAAGADLVTTLVAYENYPADAAAGLVGGFETQSVSAAEQTIYPLNLRAVGPEKLDLLYDPRVYEEGEAKALIERLVHLLGQMAANPDGLVAELDLVPPAERALVLDQFGNGGPPATPLAPTLHGLLEHWARQTPDAPALLWRGESWTFAQFNARANQLARALADQGAMPGRPVGLLMRRGPYQVVAQYACAKAGAPWVPMDPDYPPDRVATLVADCQPALVLASGVTAPALAGVPVVDLESLDLAALPASDGLAQVAPDDVAYIMYTSGTTGQPKGVMVEHRNIVNYVSHLREQWRPGPDDVMTLTTNYTFDASLLEHGLGLLAGRPTCLLPELTTLPGRALRDYLEAHQVTWAFFNPAFFMQAELPPRLRRIFTGGAAASPELVAKALRHGRWVNAYGPTEIAVVAAEWEAPVDQPLPDVIPIGRPIAGAKLTVLDGDRLCGIGLPGELCIGGAGVTRGYLGQPELTARAFVELPSEPGTASGPHGRVYRSGDLVAWRADGQLVYLGRIDDQVKILGHRIEPGEVAAAIQAHPAVVDAAVVVDDVPALHGFYVAPAAVEPAQVRAHLAAGLPHYMVPASLTRLAQLPVVAATHKVDRAALLAQVPHFEATGRAPATATELVVAAVFSEVLQVPAVGATDSFFDLGGDSLKAIAIATKLGAAGLDVTVHDIFAGQTVETLAGRLNAQAARAGVPQVAAGRPAATPTGQAATPAGSAPASRSGPAPAASDQLLSQAEAAFAVYAAASQLSQPQAEYPLTDGQRLSRLIGANASYAIVPLDRPYDPALFTAVWRAIQADHAVLRARLTDCDTLAVGPVPAAPIPVVDVTGLTADQVVKLAVDAASRAAANFGEQATGLAHRLAVLCAPDRFWAVIPLSHLVFDAFSSQVLAGRLTQDYLAGAPAHQPYDYAAYLDFLAAGPAGVTDQDVVAALDLPAFAAAARTWRPQPAPLAQVTAAAGDDPTGTAWGLIQTAFERAFPGQAVPALLVHTGRVYEGFDFTGHLGEFLDVLPVVIGPGGSGPGGHTAKLAYLRQHRLVASSLLAGRWAERLPEATSLIRGDPAAWPVVNLVLTPVDPGHLPAASFQHGPPRVVTAYLTGSRLKLMGLPAV